MGSVWINVLQQTIFFLGIVALAFAALEESHLSPHIRPRSSIQIEQPAPSSELAQP